MRKKLLYTSLWGILTLSLLSSCRTDSIATEQTIASKEKIAAFERFEKENNIIKPIAGVNQSPTPQKYISYAYPFAQIIYNFLQNHPDYAKKVENEAGTIRLDAVSQTFGDAKKAVIFPVTNNEGIVVGIWMGVINEERDYVNFYYLNPNTQGIGAITTAFQDYYNQKEKKIANGAIASIKGLNPIAKGQDPPKDPPVKDKEIPEVVITVPPRDIVTPSGPGGPNYATNPGGGMSGGPTTHGGAGNGTASSQQKDVCSQAKAVTSKDNVKKAIEELTNKMKDLQKKNGNEQIYVLGKDGGTRVIEGGQNHVIFSPDIYTQGSVHDHDSKGYAMFPPHDINSFINTVRVQNYPQNPNDTRDKSGDAFLGIVTPDGNYFMTFNGTKNDIPPMRGAGEVDKFQEEFGLQLDRYKIYNGSVPDNVLQQTFFEYLDKMGLNGKISLVKQINGNNYPITKNPDGTINNNSNNPCKN
ncbi:hypothetical protein M2T78_14990 [Elizabethkingia ursingii]|uniref:hypothetical protein n=1 Tax=Elizabethkingia ursingii TaxID=1756150 RepID=UPI0020117802|nr:hypothetical protein [Elizabethkingia ursingii]MCL1665571.1 hypothetical protein [Elizabethkingia ursingii]